jgi:hypothetical protein
VFASFGLASQPTLARVQRIVFNERWEELRREPLLTQLNNAYATYVKGLTVFSTC